ncbi:DUF302 domain-containing protein, partial [candidate division KSB1 bacterium]
RVTEELKKEGFGVLTEIDVKQTLKKKLDVEFSKYIILGACNPKFAHKALKAREDIGLLLPCNIIVYENEQGKTMVSIFNPRVMLSLVSDPEIEEIADQVSEKLERVLNNL